MIISAAIVTISATVYLQVDVMITINFAINAFAEGLVSFERVLLSCAD